MVNILTDDLVIVQFSWFGLWFGVRFVVFGGVCVSACCVSACLFVLVCVSACVLCHVFGVLLNFYWFFRAAVSLFESMPIFFEKTENIGLFASKNVYKFV